MKNLTKIQQQSVLLEVAMDKAIKIEKSKVIVQSVDALISKDLRMKKFIP